MIQGIIKNSSIIVVLGPGGVGKTTSAVTMAMLGAKQGKRVGLLSIDPAKRLADAMGLTLGHELTKVDLTAMGQMKGELHACMLDQAAVFDHMVRRFATPKIVDKIFANSVYRQASRNLGGPIEYMALAKLTELIESQSFDLIILDTPPDTHALDFLVKPSNLSGFVERGVMKWLIKPFHVAQRWGFGKLLSVGEKLMGGVAAVTGIKMLETLVEFLVLMEDVLNGFHRSGAIVTDALKRPSTKFALIMAPHHASLRAGTKISQQLKHLDFSCDLVLFNRMLPDAVRSAFKETPLQETQKVTIIEQLSQQAKAADAMIQTFEDAYQKIWENKPACLYIEEQDQLMRNLGSIFEFAEYIWNRRNTQTNQLS